MNADYLTDNVHILLEGNNTMKAVAFIKDRRVKRNRKVTGNRKAGKRARAFKGSDDHRCLLLALAGIAITRISTKGN